MEGLAYPLRRPMAHSRLTWRQGLSVRSRLVSSWRWAAAFVRGEGSFSKQCYPLEALSSLVPVYRISHSKWDFTRRCSSYDKVMMLLRRVPRHSGVGRQDGFPTQVHGVRGTWVSTAISHRDQCLRSTLPETRGG
jgi:hypothetical protein